MFAFLRNLMGSSKSSTKPAPARKRPSTRLQLEDLEDRLALSTIAPSVGSATSIGVVGNVSNVPPKNSPFQVSGNNLYVYGTSGNDNFSFTAGATSNTVTLNGSNYNVNPSQIHNIYFYGQGGSDRTILTDTLFKANATLSPHSATLSGPDYFVSVNNVLSNIIDGRSGDTASFYDSPGNDTFSVSGVSASMYDSGMTYLNYTSGFSFNNGYSTQGGKDIALFYDTPGNDTYYAGNGYAGMFNSTNTYSNYATGFAFTHGYSSAGGTDTAYLYDTYANGTSAGGAFIGSGSDAELFGVGYSNTASNFHDVEAYSTFDDFYTLYGTPAYTLHMHGTWEQEG